MKTLVCSLMVLNGVNLFAQSASRVAVPQATLPTIVSRDANSRTWTWTNYIVTPDGQTNAQPHQFVELATGISHSNNQGEYVDSSDEIVLLPDGSAAATNRQASVYLPSDIGAGSIRLVTRSGHVLQNAPAFLAFDDGTNTAVIGAITNSIGQLISSNQVLYPDIFHGSGFRADLLCTVRKAGFESDLVLRDQIPGPASLGLAANSRLLLLTEFFNTTDPTQTATVTNSASGLTDSILSFGATRMIRGKAFTLGNTTNSVQSAAPHSPQRPLFVSKTWEHIGSRAFLAEQLPFRQIAPLLKTLPLPTNTSVAVSLNSALQKHSPSRLMVPARIARKPAPPTQMAMAQADPEPGFVLDYTTVDTDQTNYTFQTGQTYLVDGEFDCVGTSTFESGTIIKLDNDGQIDIDPDGTIVCPPGPDTPALFTSLNDNSIGESMAGSSDPYYTGTPNGGDVGTALNINCATSSISNLCFYYSSYPVQSLGDIDVWHIQFFDTQICVSAAGSVGFHNVLINIDQIDWPVLLYSTGNFIGENVTADGVTPSFGLVYLNDPTSQSATFTNCLFTDGQWVSVNGGAWNNSPVPIYETAAAADYYLTNNSPYRNVGTTNINPRLLSEIQTMTTYAPQDGGFPDTNGTDLGYHYPVNEDSDNDGLPDWWEWKYFGTYAYSGTNLDSAGNTLLYDYQNGMDPNVIAFSIEATNNYVSSTNVALQLNIRGGVPDFIAISVDDTNYASDAVWSEYISSNIVVDLGAIEGWHEVWIGLRGFASSGYQTWMWKGLKVDLTPPLVVITNPAMVSATSTTVSVPVIQLQGYSPEALENITYDLTNALGLVTNQGFGLIRQYYDTNLWEFTTNYFECLDIPLTNGLNTVILHATDLAGNTTTTNFNFTVDYSSKTNPVVQITWPSDGMQLCTNNFALRGQVDDPTVTVTASITDTNGDTNVMTGLVERNGRFWVENVPLSGGTNSLTITVSNVANQITVTNLSIEQGSLALSVTPASDTSQFWQPTISVGGAISDPTYAVWVNGVMGTNNGDGTWSADNVTNTQGGVAIFDVTAYPAGEAPPPGLSGSAVNPRTANAQDSNSETDKPMRIYMKSYDSDLGSSVINDGFGGQFDYQWHWADQQSGYNIETLNTQTTIADPAYFNDYISTLTLTWPPGGIPETALEFGVDNNTYESYSWTNGGLENPIYEYTANEHFTVKASFNTAGLTAYDAVFADIIPWTDYVGGNWTVSGYHRTADTVCEMETGGKDSPWKHWFIVNSGVSEELDKLVSAPDVTRPSVPVPYNQVEIGTFGYEWPDGNAVRLMANTTEPMDATPRVKGKDTFTFIMPSGDKMLPRHQTCAAYTDTNRWRTDLGVGEQVKFDYCPVGTVWSVTAGSVDQPMGSMTYTAPSNKGPATVTGWYNGQTYKVPFNVEEPTGAMANVVSSDCYTPPVAEAGMYLEVHMKPTDVSFNRMQVLEVGESATGVTGYFTDPAHPAPAHNSLDGANQWYSLDCYNTWDSNDHASSDAYSQPWVTSSYSGGGFTWKIPFAWKVGNGPATTNQDGWSQVYTLGADGTVTIQKFDHTETRSPSQNCGSAQ